MKWSIPIFFPDHEFKDMWQDSDTLTKWTAVSDYDDYTWEFHFDIQSYPAAGEFDIILAYAIHL